MRNTRITLTALILVTAAGTVLAQVWEKKEYTKWSKEDCRKIMEDSPWASKFGIASLRNDAFSGSSSNGTGNDNVRIDFVAQLRSASPVRQAQVRMAQFDNKYDQMTSEQKTAFDARSVEFLERTFEDRIVVVIEMRSNIEIYVRQLVQMWSSINEGAVPAYAYLINARGDRIPPVHFVRPTHGNPSMQLTFPRRTQNGDVVGPEDKEFVVEIPGIRVDDQTEPVLRFHFKPQKMSYQGKFEM